MYMYLNVYMHNYMYMYMYPNVETLFRRAKTPCILNRKTKLVVCIATTQDPLHC